ncbi:hypothetical protein ACJMK2_013438, partial [Sinanodonta woodiana]
DICENNMFGLKSEHVRYIENMTGYLKQPPRQLIGTTSISMDRHYAETPVNETGKKSLAGSKRKREDEKDEGPNTPKRHKAEIMGNNATGK